MSDRYQALGLPYPDPEAMCRGQCEGTGFVPVHGAPPDGASIDSMTALSPLETDHELLALWAEAEAIAHATDGWHFVRCPACAGTGTA